MILALFCGACSERQVDSDSQSTASAVEPATRPTVIYVEATADEINAAKKGVSEEDFSVIADDLMYYRSAAIDHLEEWDIPYKRVTGRRPMQFTVGGVSRTVDFRDTTLLDFIVVHRPNEQPRIFAPNEVDAARSYLTSDAEARDTTQQI